jgi:hypothetical protein
MLPQDEDSATFGPSLSGTARPFAKAQSTNADPLAAIDKAPIGYIVLHNVKCSNDSALHAQHSSQESYFDIPRLRVGSNKSTPLTGQRKMNDLDGFLEDHPSIAFVVLNTYSCKDYHAEIEGSFIRHWMPPMPAAEASAMKPYFFILREDGKHATKTSEHIMLSRGLSQALTALHECHPKYLQTWGDESHFHYPYLQLYHSKSFFTGTPASKLASFQQHHLKRLSDYFDAHLESEYAEAEEQFQKGLVSRKHWAKLFRPNETVITMKNGAPVAHLTISCPHGVSSGVFGRLVLPCWSWHFDGAFIRKSAQIEMEWPSSRSDTVPISDLSAYPLRLDTTGLEDQLRRRGRVFWSCRKRRYVSYDVSLPGMEVQRVNLTNHVRGGSR